MDGNLTIDHDHDSQGEHGSHVAGIAAANSYIPGEDGYVSALESVKVQGVAPEAQLLVMKVFGAAGGAYDSDYMAAIEDAIVLGADSINLSLGSGAPGYATDPTQAYQDILNNLVNSDAVVTISAGNSMAAPQAAGMAALAAQYMADKGLTGKTGVSARALSQSLLMSTATTALDAAGLPGYTALSGAASVKPISAAYDENGVLYAADMSSDNTSTLYTIDPKTFQATAVGSSSQVFYTDMAQAPSLHQNVLAAVYGPYLLLVDKERGEYVGALCQYPNSLTGIAYCGSFYSTANKV